VGKESFHKSFRALDHASITEAGTYWAKCSNYGHRYVQISREFT